MMNPEELKQLLEKYWEGKTTLEEEEQIKGAFSSDPNLSHQFPEAALFKAFNEEKKMEPTNINPDKAVQTEAKIRHLGFETVLKWAAVLVIVFSTVFLLIPSNNTSDTGYSDSFESPEEAYEEARRALALVGGKMNHGRVGAADKMEKFNTVLPVKN